MQSSSIERTQDEERKFIDQALRVSQKYDSVQSTNFDISSTQGYSRNIVKQIVSKDVYNRKNHQSTGLENVLVLRSMNQKKSSSAKRLVISA